MKQKLPHLIPHPSHTFKTQGQSQHIHELLFCFEDDMVYCKVCQREWKKLQYEFSKVSC